MRFHARVPRHHPESPCSHQGSRNRWKQVLEEEQKGEMKVLTDYCMDAILWHQRGLIALGNIFYQSMPLPLVTKCKDAKRFQFYTIV